MEHLRLSLLRGNYMWPGEGRLLLFVDDRNAKQHPCDLQLHRENIFWEDYLEKKPIAEKRSKSFVWFSAYSI